MKKHFFALLGLALTFFAGALIGSAAGFNPAVSGLVLAGISGSKYLIVHFALPNAQMMGGLMLDSLDLTELAAKLGDYNRENRDILVSEMLLDQDFTEGMTVYDDVGDELPLPNLGLTDLIKPGANKDFDPTDNAVKADARILKVRDIKVDLLFIPSTLEKTWLGYLKKNKQDPFEFPFEKFLMGYINSKVKENLRLKSVYKGVYDANGSTPDDTMDGFLKLVIDEIDDDNIDPIATGAIDENNVIEKVEMVYDGLGEAYKAVETIIPCSPTIYDWYTRKYREDFGRNMDYKGMKRNQVYLDGTLCALTREPGLTGSQRLMASVANNFGYGVSSASGYNIDIQKFDRQLKILIDFKAGVQFHQIVKNALAVNDQE